MLVAALAALLSPMALAAQEKQKPLVFPPRSASADAILAALASGLDLSSPEDGEEEQHDVLGQASWFAELFLTQYTGDDYRDRPDHFGTRSQGELDAFADRLVAIALAHPPGEVARQIGSVLSGAGSHYHDEDPERTRYTGAFDALARIYMAGARSNLGFYHLIRLDPRRAMEVGMGRLEAGPWQDEFDACLFLHKAWSYGKVVVLNGELAFDSYEGVDLSPGSEGRELSFTAYDEIQEVGRQLHEAGYLTRTNPCPDPFGGREALPVDEGRWPPDAV